MAINRNKPPIIPNDIPMDFPAVDLLTVSGTAGTIGSTQYDVITYSNN